MDLRLIAAGFVVGIVAGLSGIGGSSLLAPLLILVFGMNAALAVGTDLVYSAPTKALAAFQHWRQGTVDRAAVAGLVAGGVPGALAGLGSFAFVRARLNVVELDSALRHAIGSAILFAAVAMALASLWRLYRKARPSRDVGEDVPWTLRPAVTIAIGFLAGFLVAFTSIGSGSLTLPLLVLALPAVALRKLIGSEIVFAAFVVPVAAAGQAALHDVDWMMALALTAGALPGAYLGARLCARLGEAALRPAVIGILALAGYRLL